MASVLIKVSAKQQNDSAPLLLLPGKHPLRLTGMGAKMRLWNTTVSTRKAMVATPMMNQMKKAVVGRGIAGAEL